MAFTLYPWLENTHEKNVARRMWCNLELKTIMLLHLLFHGLQMETSFLFKLFTRVRQIGHLPRNRKAKMVVDHSGLTLALFDNHWWNLHTCQRFVNEFGSLFSIGLGAIAFTQWPKDGVVHWLLECPLIIQISRLDEKSTPAFIFYLCLQITHPNRSLMMLSCNGL